MEEHDPHVNPLGVKGDGEIAMVDVAPATLTPSSTRPASASASYRSRRTSCFKRDTLRTRNARQAATKEIVHDHPQTHARDYWRLRRPRSCASCRCTDIDCHDTRKEWNYADHTNRHTASRPGPTEYFTGTVRIDPLFPVREPGRVSAGSVTFEPGARTAWHTHPLGQTLIITAGLGLVQREGGPIEEVRPGDIIWFPPGLKHWHGATPTTAMTHIAIQETLNGKKSIGWRRSATNDIDELEPEHDEADLFRANSRSGGEQHRGERSCSAERYGRCHGAKRSISSARDRHEDRDKA